MSIEGGDLKKIYQEMNNAGEEGDQILGELSELLDRPIDKPAATVPDGDFYTEIAAIAKRNEELSSRTQQLTVGAMKHLKGLFSVLDK